MDSARTILRIRHIGSPCGELVLGEAGGELCLCCQNATPIAERAVRRLQRAFGAELREASSPALERAAAQLCEYFARRRTSFDIPLRIVGTPFQKRVWEALLEIPYGETRSYRQIARRIGNEKGVRAVAQAIGANAIAIIIPCHRVIGSDGSLTGFAGGLAAKRTLLDLETASPPDTALPL